LLETRMLRSDKRRIYRQHREVEEAAARVVRMEIIRKEEAEAKTKREIRRQEKVVLMELKRRKVDAQAKAKSSGGRRRLRPKARGSSLNKRIWQRSVGCLVGGGGTMGHRGASRVTHTTRGTTSPVRSSRGRRASTSTRTSKSTGTNTNTTTSTTIRIMTVSLPVLDGNVCMLGLDRLSSLNLASISGSKSHSGTVSMRLKLKSRVFIKILTHIYKRFRAVPVTSNNNHPPPLWDAWYIQGATRCCVPHLLWDACEAL
jgi:hypothetical protein